MQRPMDPTLAMDYPKIDPTRWTAWVSNGVRWPHANRSVRYLSKYSFDPLKGYALYTPAWENAQHFATEAELQAWIAEQAEKRGTPYYNLRLTRVQELLDYVFNPDRSARQR